MEIDFVKKQVSLLNKKWFESKKIFYQKEPFYHAKSGGIYEIIPAEQGVYDDEKDEFIKDDDIVIDVNFKKYCWNDYFPGSLRDQEYQRISDEELPSNSEIISIRITQWIESTVDGITDNSTIHNVILSVIENIKEQIEILINENEMDDLYIEILDDFLTHCRQAISKQFKRIHQVHLLSTDYSENERLDFDLNQEELGALLYILYRADIIKTSTPGDTSFLNFCEDHFYFYNQKKRSNTKANFLRNKFNDAKQKRSKARKSVIEKLKTTFSDL